MGYMYCNLFTSLFSPARNSRCFIISHSVVSPRVSIWNAARLWERELCMCYYVDTVSLPVLSLSLSLSRSQKVKEKLRSLQNSKLEDMLWLGITFFFVICEFIIVLGIILNKIKLEVWINLTKPCHGKNYFS